MVDQAGRDDALSWTVPPNRASTRLDAFVRSCLPHLSRRKLGRAISEKLILLNGRAGKKGDRLNAGDRLVFCGSADWLGMWPPAAIHLELPVVYEDASILTLDKPAGMATHGFSARDRLTLANLLAAHRPELLKIGKSPWEPGLVHRLDIETSGLVLVAKTQAVFTRLRAQFRRRAISKTYWALVWGNAEAQGAVDFALVHDDRDKRKMRVAGSAEGAKRRRTWRALTYYRKLGGVPGLSLLEINMVTGVTHQIRVHLATIGHPIVGDNLYGVESQPAFGMRRHFLHAKELELRHPDDDRIINLRSEIPGELKDVLERVGIGG